MISSSTPLLDKYLGDRRFLLTLPRAVTLQVLHPAIAAALAQHVHNRLWDHKRRAVSQMIYMAYGKSDPSPVIRFGHEHVKGVTSTGRRYHALKPDIFFFQHATYVDTLVTAINTFSEPLTQYGHERLYDECCLWYARYGVSTRPMPATWADFTAYFTEACASQLALTEHCSQLLSQALRPSTWVPSRLPGLGVRGVQHPRACELLDIRQNSWERTAFAIYARAIRSQFAMTPHRARYVSQARRRSDLTSSKG
ncbi:oxygenase MpaB family protein [Mycobacteroides franklinii]|uniref:oxygenase MpaB family protein n=1 Tax=Mycobacteroides franklinii TaxID=948102 RepID=UPI001F2702E4|nr:oxygenase MpaB family protein [Mycobacteroides franklinii]